ncbi:nucleotide disphospho-sugar-binding domain-containing protein [Pseudomarimonas arenosa]|uniref:Erythromycin biosynthesis protein CIII-like C-terminal domain-containing protein n=1 Tax=Pseudomarimonas arenosa TaxID=2774145 RepID=A0AAW3ZIB4_9GAMM|nr:nucleotide disphospho-sugar-binding domain-containing protein [Pseudomarimonas arenosa]MBD8524877.1 hypothetical protein [Pseudomarimonas arenosa]
MGHAVRAVSIATQLSSLFREIRFFSADLYEHVRRATLGRFPLECIPISELRTPFEEFGPKLTSCLDVLAPDLVLFDIEPTRWLSTFGPVSAPSVYISNIFLTHPFGPSTAQDKYWASHGPRANNIREKSGLPLINDPREIYRRDLVMLADPPCITSSLTKDDPTFAIIGPQAAPAEVALPHDFPKSDPLVVFCGGSTGSHAASEAIIHYLRRQFSECKFVCLGESALCDSVRPFADQEFAYAPLQKALLSSRLLVSHGGSGTSYLGLSGGVPNLVIPGHANHRILGDIIESIGAGVCLNSEDSPPINRDWPALALGAKKASLDCVASESPRCLIESLLSK